MSRRPLTSSTTYTLAHTAQCKLKLAANRPDRNLRFVLGHAFTLDNLMLRIVEIENQSAKSQFQEGKAPSDHGGDVHYDCTAAKPVTPEPDPHYDCTATQPTPSEPEPASGRGRSISFRDNNARPSSIGTAGVSSNNKGNSSPARKRSPPPVSISQNKYLEDEDDDDDTSSDDYEEPDTYDYSAPPSPENKKASGNKQKPTRNAYSDEEEEDEDDGLSLTRFASASARPPRMVRSGSSSSEDEDEDGPTTPPQLPADVDVKDLISGVKDEELESLFESVRGCACHGHREDPDAGRKTDGVWDVPAEKAGGKHLAVVAIAA